MKTIKAWAITGNSKILSVSQNYQLEIFATKSDAKYNLPFITELHTKLPPDIVPVEIHIVPKNRK
jgi:hypothetical protein